jgi:TRAP-type C4-dicarboxylate transport system substrate-binding protein
MKKSRLVVALVIAVMTFTLVFAGCGGGSDSDKKDGESGDPIIIKVNSFLTEGSSLTEGTKTFVAAIEEESNGELKGEGYYNGTLLGFADSWEGCGAGTVDVAYIGPAILGQYSRLLDGLQLPFTGLSPDEINTTKAFNEIVNSHEEFAKDMEKHNLKVLYVEGVPASGIHAVKKEIKVPEDCKGIIINALGKCNTDFFSGLGAQTVALDFGEYLLSAQKGVADAFLDGWGAIRDSQLIEALKSHTVFGDVSEEHPGGGGLSTSPMTYVVNLDKWNSLSESQQKALVKAAEKGVSVVPALDLVGSQEAYNTAIDRGDIMVNVKGADLEAWYKASKSVIDDWIAAMDDQGYDGKALYDSMQASVDKYQ